MKKNQFQEALQLFDLVYEGFVSRFGEEHPDIANLYVEYGLCYASMNNREKAIEYYELAGRIYAAHKMQEKADYVCGLTEQ